MEIKSFGFATVDEKGLPDTRIIDVMMAKDDGIYFLTARGKNFYEQLLDNMFVAITGLSKNWEMVSFRGRIKRMPQDLLGEIFEKNPSMEHMYPGKTRKILEVFCIYEGQGEFFDLSKVPIFRETFLLGDAKEHKKGYHITDGCIECGICLVCCPQKCTEKGTPHRIREEECLHCGLCSENCPAGAIERY